MVLLLNTLSVPENFIFLADAYYASRKIILPLLKAGNHLVSRVKTSATAYFPASPTPPGKRGRKKVYGEKIKLASLFDDINKMLEAPSPVYGETKVMLRYRSIDLLWRPIGIMVRFVLVIHPTRGRCILMGTNLKMSALEIIELYSYRFKIEVSFKQAIHTIGAYLYHFWMVSMKTVAAQAGHSIFSQRKQKIPSGSQTQA